MTPSMSREAVLALGKQVLDAARRRDVSGMMDLYADDAVAISPVFGEMRGRAAIAATGKTLFSTVADFQVQISHFLVSC